MERNFFVGEIAPIVTPLLTWFSKCARILPWREDPTPYHVWVSEIMLQQTRVEAVKAYYERFIRHLPDVTALAEADEDKLLKLWEGLGYYSRIRNMHKASKIIMEQYGGNIPADFEVLLKLPGIGRYTAGAISSIAFNKSESAVDGNVLRVLSRICASYADVSLPQVRKEAEAVLREIIPKGKATEFSQAMMELGAILCLPNGVPLCEQCPLAIMCEARKQGITSQLPVKKAPLKRKKEQKTVLVLIGQNRLALSKRDNKGLLAGMWELPNVPGKLTMREIQNFLFSKRIQEESVKQLPEAKHIFSHIEWDMTGYFATVIEEGYAEFEWVSLEELEQNYAVASAFSVYLKIAKENLS
jgi:A/G-specific adenine glycosylase